MKKLMFIALALLSCAFAQAEDVEIDGVRYVIRFYDQSAAIDRTIADKVKSETLVIPEKVTYEDEEFTVTEIFDKGLPLGRNQVCTKIVLPNTITKIGTRAFSGSQNVKEIVLPNSLKTISEGMCSLCSSLESVVIPESVTEIYGSAFMNCDKLASINIPQGVTYIGYNAFFNTAIKELTLPESMTSIAQGALRGMGKLRKITLPNSITEIEGSTFGGCQRLRSVVLPSTLKTIPARIFIGCAIDTIVIPEGVRYIDRNAFESCRGLKHIVFPSTLVAIGPEAFKDCPAIETLELPAGLQQIASWALAGCVGLKTIINHAATPQKIDGLQVFYNDEEQVPAITLMVPKGCADTYKKAVWWSGMQIVEME